jgi:hypothetical protein
MPRCPMNSGSAIFSDLSNSCSTWIESLVIVAKFQNVSFARAAHMLLWTGNPSWFQILLRHSSLIRIMIVNSLEYFKLSNLR